MENMLSDSALEPEKTLICAMIIISCYLHVYSKYCSNKKNCRGSMDDKTIKRTETRIDDKAIKSMETRMHYRLLTSQCQLQDNGLFKLIV